MSIEKLRALVDETSQIINTAHDSDDPIGRAVTMTEAMMLEKEIAEQIIRLYDICAADGEFALLSDDEQDAYRALRDMAVSSLKPA